MSGRFAQLSRNYLCEEGTLVAELLDFCAQRPQLEADIQTSAHAIVERVRGRPERLSALDRFLGEYDLTTSEGVLLLCLAEALIRIPDAATADALIADKIADADWHRHLGRDDLLINASTWGLLLTGKVLAVQAYEATTPRLEMILKRLGQPLIRTAVRHAMRIVGQQFVMAESIASALAAMPDKTAAAELFSFDMLGEAALTAADAERYEQAYHGALSAVIADHVGHAGGADGSGDDAHGISVKLSALCPRFEVTQRTRAVAELSVRLRRLAAHARDGGIQITVDAEECERLELTLTVFAAVRNATELRDWAGLGIAVQAYQKRAPEVITFLAALAQACRHCIPVRLVKGAYWDSEIKMAQARGLADYPVFTRKSNTDVAYFACVHRLLEASPYLTPQFATHNAHTVAYVLHHAGGRTFEFQRLFGMGEALYEAVREIGERNLRLRIYAPIGSFDALLPYLVRRLLENGANTSFVHRIADGEVAIADIVRDPLAHARRACDRHPAIVLPQDLFGVTRRNSHGLNFGADDQIATLLAGIRALPLGTVRVQPLLDGTPCSGDPYPVTAPADQTRNLGVVEHTRHEDVLRALERAHAAWPAWNAAAADDRAGALERCADSFEAQHAELIALCIAEAGKTIPAAHAEVREAVDLLRFYAAECRRLFAAPTALPGPAGEANTVQLEGRGVFLCISPWNFPLAIYTGQIAAALAAGNTVLAKPAEQTSLSAHRVTELLFAAGIPATAVQFVPGLGPAIADAVMGEDRLEGVAFTGSGAAAQDIARRLALRHGPPPTLIAETGGVNAMIVDSSALPEQVVRDALRSAFDSAGQRCSALRVLYLQDDIADRVIELVAGAMRELIIGDPADLATDIGPVIDADAWQRLGAYATELTGAGRILAATPLPRGLEHGLFIGPTLVHIDTLDDVPGEVFGPFLHVRRFDAGALDQVCAEINAAGYGLTVGIQSRIGQRVDQLAGQLRAGNVYVNRDMIGAVVQSQPFGGRGLSGTGPKAGGGSYVQRFATEKTITVNTAAVGGNAALLTLDDG